MSNHQSAQTPHGDGHAEHEAAHNSSAAVTVTTPVTQNDDFASKAATIALVGVGVALIEVGLIPGMLIGVAAAFAPNFVPKLGEALKPLVKSTVRASYTMAQKTREAVAEASEHVQDMVAEARMEHEHAQTVASQAHSAGPELAHSAAGTEHKA